MLIYHSSLEFLEYLTSLPRELGFNTVLLYHEMNVPEPLWSEVLDVLPSGNNES